MRHAQARLAVALFVCLMVGASLARAQDQPVVFIHGVGSSGETWRDTADRLQARLQIAPARAEVSWWKAVEFQSSQVDSQFGNLPGSTIVVGHSLGGLVAREWGRSHPLDGVITLGAPNRGAPIANHANEWLGFNSSLFGAVGNAFYWLGHVSYDKWWWVFSAVEGSLNWGGYLADFSVNHLLAELGLQYGAPFAQEVYVGSPYLNDLNANAGREAAAIPSRIAIVNTATEYWKGGPFRLKNPQYAGQLSIVTDAAAAALDYAGYRVFAEADPLDSNAQSLAYGLWDAASWLWNFEDFWCRTISDDRPLALAHCLPNDGFIPTWSQFYPNATVNFEVNGGPVHTEETDHFDDYIFTALTNFMHVPPRGAEPSTPPPAPGPPPPPSPGSVAVGGPDTLAPDRSLFPGESVGSDDGEFYVTYQWDGNFVLYRRGAVPLWHTHTDGTSAGRAIIQLDGNLVIYDAESRAVWSSETSGFDGAALVVQTDGNLVLYSPAGAALWSSGTSGS